jgi:hypothetical protein
MILLIDDSEPLVIHKRIDGKYHVDKIEDQPLSKGQLAKLMVRLGYQLHELAFAMEEFRMYPELSEAYFGMDGLFMYCK